MKWCEETIGSEGNPTFQKILAFSSSEGTVFMNTVKEAPFKNEMLHFVEGIIIEVMEMEEY